MRRTLINILLLLFVAAACASNTIRVPLRVSTVQLLPQDGPTGSTPDPTDPTQFRVELTGNMLTVITQPEHVSYVVIRSDFSEKNDEDYFFALSYDSVSCPITRAGEYSIAIGCWNTDLVGLINVKRVDIYTFDGQRLDGPIEDLKRQPGLYIIRLETDLGVTTLKTVCK